MSDPECAGAYTPTAADLAAYRRLHARAAALAAGDDIPSYADRLAGLPPFRDSPRADLVAIANREIDRDVHGDDAVAALRKLAGTPTRWAAQQARAAIVHEYLHDEARFALDWCAAWLGDGDARGRVVAAIQTAYSRCRITEARQALAIHSFLRIRASDPGEEKEYKSGDWSTYLDNSVREAASGETAMRVYHATAAAEAAPEQPLEDAVADELAKLSTEPEPSPVPDPGPKSLIKQKPGNRLVVVPKLPDGGTSWKKEIAKSWAGKAGVPLPLLVRGDLAAQRKSLVARWPHAAEIIDTVLSDLAASETVRFRPTLLVGEPGSGKSSLARAILESVGLPCELQSLAGVHDASLMGTSAQWSSARESVPLQLIKRAAMASVAVIWDEVEKVGTRRDSGNAMDALLPMLEVDQARRYRDLALEVEVDLSMVSHFGTANSLEGVPAPLRDRMRILVMPQPGWEHLGALTRQIVDRIAAERGLDSRWYPPLAEDELDLVRKAWPGGSLRQLTRIVTTLIDGREQLMGRA